MNASADNADSSSTDRILFSLIIISFALSDESAYDTGCSDCDALYYLLYCQSRETVSYRASYVSLLVSYLCVFVM